MDYLARMYSTDPDPVRSGDTKSWFFFYRWMVEGETHFDVPEDNKHLFKDIKEGDRLWFYFTDIQHLVGYVEVLRVQEDPTRDVWEFWYDGTRCHKFNPLLDSHDMSESLAVGTVISEEKAKKWLACCDQEKYP